MSVQTVVMRWRWLCGYGLEPGQHGGLQPIGQNGQDVQTIGGGLGGKDSDKIAMPFGQGDLINAEHC